VAVLRVPNPQLPWTSARGDDSRFQKILLVLFALYVAAALVITVSKLPPLLQPEPQLLPPPLAQVVLQKVELAKPPEKPLQPPKPAEKITQPKPVEKVTAPKPVAPAPAPQPRPRDIVAPSKTVLPAKRQGSGGPAGGREAPIELVQQARANAAKAGVLQFRDDLADMRESVDVANVTRSNLTRGTDTAERTERALITGKASGGSGGINTAALSTNTGGIALSGRETTRIDSPGGGGGRSAEGGGRGRGEGTGSGTGTGAGTGRGNGKAGDLVGTGGGSGGRGDEAIRRIMDQQKGGIFAIYNRALRQDPSLQGKFVFEMVIEPDGSVSDIRLVSSELRDNELTGKILARIRMIDFGTANVLRTRVNYSLDFLPNG
jgi:outer membrane biosynthesis protein TonB